MWVAIFEDGKFQRNLTQFPWRDNKGRDWLRFDLRDPDMPGRDASSTGLGTTLYFPHPLTGERVGPLVTKPYVPFKAFHQTLLTNLVGSSSEAPGSRGILKEGFRYGRGTHGAGNSGVNFYSCAPISNFKSTDLDIWVICHVLAVEGKHLSGGAEYRWCVKGRAGQRCRRVTLQGFSVLKHLTPAIFRY